MQTSPWLGGAKLDRSGPFLQGRLNRLRCITTIIRMISRAKWRRFLDTPVIEWALFVLGVLLLIVSPLVGLIPGPGGVVVAGIGLALILKTSMWAKRHYVRLKKKRVKLRGQDFIVGEWTDWALRRRSAKRRKAVRKATGPTLRN
jgi:hypothetical protein